MRFRVKYDLISLIRFDAALTSLTMGIHFLFGQFLDGQIHPHEGPQIKDSNFLSRLLFWPVNGLVFGGRKAGEKSLRHDQMFAFAEEEAYIVWKHFKPHWERERKEKEYVHRPIKPEFMQSSNYSSLCQAVSVPRHSQRVLPNVFVCRFTSINSRYISTQTRIVRSISNLITFFFPSQSRCNF